MERQSQGAKRQVALLAAGVLLGGAVMWFWAGRPDSEEVATPSKATATMGAGPAVAATRTDCNYAAILPAGPGDATLSMTSDFSGRTPEQVKAWILNGKEAAAGGRVRDAETAFIMACRGAAGSSKPDALVLAEAKYQLGRHYAVRAMADDAPKASREAAATRGEALYSDALHVFLARHGADHERSRFASEGLQALLEEHPLMARAPAIQRPDTPAASGKATAKAPEPQVVARQTVPDTPRAELAKPAEAPRVQVPAKDVVPAPKAAEPARAVAVVRPVEPASPAAVRTPETARSPEPARPPVLARAPEPVKPAAPTRPLVARPPVEIGQATGSPGIPVGTVVAERVRPSFDCGKARSTSEKLICADPELARMDRELGRLHVRARIASGDESGFQRRSDAAWRQRESTCRDRECLRQWYAQRREDLSRAAEPGG